MILREVPGAAEEAELPSLPPRVLWTRPHGARHVPMEITYQWQPVRKRSSDCLQPG